MPFNLAIIGGGGISRAHVNAAKATGGAIAIAAVVDPVEANRNATSEAAGASAFASLDELLASPIRKTIHAVIVCTPPSVRVELVRAALEAGLAVLSEKPLAHTLGDARTLIELARKHPRVRTHVGYCHRFTPAVIEMKRRIDAGELGGIARFENTFACNLEARMKTHWMSDPKISGGGSLIDTGCHSLDLFHHLIGPGAVRSAVFHHAWSGRGESSATVLIKSERGHVAGVIQSGWAEPARFIITIIGAKGSLSYDYEKPTDLVLRPNDGPEQHIPVETHEVRFQRQLEAFANPAGEAKPATFDDGLAVAENVEQAYRLK